MFNHKWSTFVHWMSANHRLVWDCRSDLAQIIVVTSISTHLIEQSSCFMIASSYELKNDNWQQLQNHIIFLLFKFIPSDALGWSLRLVLNLTQMKKFTELNWICFAELTINLRFLMSSFYLTVKFSISWKWIVATEWAAKWNAKYRVTGSNVR